MTGGVAVSRHGELQDSCPEKTCASEADYDLRNQVDALKVTTDVLLPLGGALIVMIVYGERDDPERAQVRVAPAIGGDQGGLFLEGRV